MTSSISQPSPVVRSWLSKAAPETDQDRLAAQMAEALATPANMPYGDPPKTVSERDGERLAQIMATRAAPRIATQNDLVETMPVRANAAEQEASRRSASAGGGIVPPPRRTP